VTGTAGDLRVRDVMTRSVRTVSVDDPVSTAAAVLRRWGVGALPVLDADGRVVGIVAELDLLRAGPGAGTSVGAVMRTPVRCLSPGARLAGVADALVQDGLRSMPVVLGGELVGIVSAADLLITTTQEDRRPDPARPEALGDGDRAAQAAPQGR
ncbi:CBS domain-containing protein, partial [Klenkia terrae]|jgi:CBS domain-containing protein